MALQLQLRNDTAANWTAQNPILAVAEPGVENDTFKFKIGDGVTAWNSLVYGVKLALAGESIEVDYIGTSDQTGNTIPNYTFGRKGSIPYFGDSPLVEGESQRIAGFITSTGAAQRTLLASFPVPAAAVVSNQEFRFAANLFARIPTVNVDAWALLIDMEDGTAVDQGVLITMGDAQLQNFVFEGILRLIPSGFDLLLSGSDLKATLVSSALGASKTAALLGKVLEPGLDIFDIPSVLTSPSVANSINIYLVDLTATAAQTALVTGRVTIDILS